MTTRRQFLSIAGSSAMISLASSTPSFLLRAAKAVSAKSGDNVLVVVQLTGGNDGLNTVVPFNNELYRKARPTLAMPAGQVLKINDELGFHPSMRGFSDLLEQNRLSIIQGIGYANPNRSHFESMDIWHTAQTATQSRSVGWLGRYLDDRPPQPGDAAALHFGEEVQPLALAALKTPVSSVRSLERFRLDVGGRETVRRAIEESASASRNSENELLSFIQSSTIAAISASERVEAAVKNYSTTTKYPPGGLPEKLKIVAQLIDAGFSTRIYYVTLDGFDTHSTQAAAHSGLLDQLSGAVGAFVEDIGLHGHLDRVVVMAFSEFGRRVAENASQGTDHGAAAPMFLAGGKVKPGLIGVHPRLDDLDDGDLKFHTDFRSVYAELLTQWLGHGKDTNEILGGTFEPLSVIRA